MAQGAGRSAWVSSTVTGTALSHMDGKNLKEVMQATAWHSQVRTLSKWQAMSIIFINRTSTKESADLSKWAYSPG